MSFEFYSKWWAGTKEILEKLVAKDQQIVSAKKTIRSRELANKIVGGLYAKYSMVIQDLGVILDQLAQPQKRVTVRKIMDCATARLYELNEELRNIDISDFHYIDGALVELKLIPHDVEILDPILYYLRNYTVEELWKKTIQGERIYTPPPPPPPPPDITEQKSQHVQIEEVKEEESAPPPPPTEKEKKRPKKYVPPVKELSAEELAEMARKQQISKAIQLIQTAERGRQARLYFVEKNSDYQIRKQMREGKKPVIVEPEVQETSTLQIQRVWRGHAGRQLVRRKETKRRFIINMYEPSWKSYEEFEILEKNLQKRRDYRDQRIKEYIEMNLNEKSRIFRLVAPGLFEDIGDEIREWFYQWYTQVKNFDKYPSEEKGGTIIVVRGETLTPKEWIDEVERKRRERVKNKGKDKAKEKAEKEKKKKEAAEKKKKEKEKRKKEAARKRKKHLKPWDFEMEYEPTATKEAFPGGFDEYQELWGERKDEDNPEEVPYFDIIHEEKCYEMQLEVRKQVDVMMRLELELLEEALAKDRAKAKGKKYKPKKKKKKKKKKRKKKGKKDPTGNRTIEDLFQELVDNGIIHPYEKALLKDFRGDFSYNNWEFRNMDFDPAAVLGDVRQALTMNVIAPVSTGRLKKARSVLLMGPRLSGKHLLANAVFTESQCVLFDLSPNITAGKYEGKKGMKMLLHLINKMSRLLQPSIIYFNGAEKIFYKKVPKEEKELDPKRIGKKLLKGIIKPIKPEDQVIVFGITGKPWLASPAKLKKNFERIILIPRPDYGSVFLYWKELLLPYHGVDRNFNISALTEVTRYYTFPDIKKAVETIFTPRRIVELCHRPLSQAELYETLINVEPISDKEFKKFLKLLKKTPLGKERGRYNKYAQAKRDQEAKQAEKNQQRQQKK